MSNSITLSSLTFVKPKELAEQLSDTATSDRVAVIDVRDTDYIGGHIKGCIHTPIDQLDVRMPELLRTLSDKDRVVFHCMLSQVRGPKAALAYARAKAAAEAKRAREETKGAGATSSAEEAPSGEQEVCVLEGGFTNWEISFGKDKSLTEGYVKELWDAEIFSHS